MKKEDSGGEYPVQYVVIKVLEDARVWSLEWILAGLLVLASIFGVYYVMNTTPSVVGVVAIVIVAIVVVRLVQFEREIIREGRPRNGEGLD